MEADEVVARARANLGVRFRPQGRDAEHGLDCVGAAASAFGLVAVRRNYRLQSGDVGEVERELGGLGFDRSAPSAADAGNLLLVRVNHAQLHIVLLTPEGYLHADAGLRRVVEVPGPVPWPIVSAWRYALEERH